MCALVPMLWAAPEQRMYSFSSLSPDLVEARIRQWVPERARVLMNRERGQVMVIAEPEIHVKIARMMERLDRPVPSLKVRLRRNEEWQDLEWLSGAPGTLSVTSHPPEDLVALARTQLAPELRELPVQGAAFETHLSLLREDPPVARLRVVPAIAFGVVPPYEVIRREDMAMDLLIRGDEYNDLGAMLSKNVYYARFLREQPDPERPPRPVTLLLSLEGTSTVKPPAQTPGAPRP